MSPENFEESCYRIPEISEGVLLENSELTTSLACMEMLLAKAGPEIVQEAIMDFRELMDHPLAVEHMIGREEMLADGTYVKVAEETAQARFDAVVRHVCGSALISAHSYFESVVLKELLRLTVLCDRDGWVRFFSDKKISMSDIASLGVDAALDSHFQKHIDGLQREGMPEMLTCLLSFFKFDYTTKSPIKGYTFNPARLEQLDGLRHDFAHNKKPAYTMAAAKNDLEFFLRTNLHLIWCVMRAFGITGKHRPGKVRQTFR